MLRAFFALTVLTGAPLAHADEVTDVLLLPGEQQLWIALDGQPTGFSFDAGNGVITLNLNGFEVQALRDILPVSSQQVRSVRVQPGTQGTTIRIEGSFASSAAELRRGGVLVDLSGRTAYRVAAPEDTDEPYSVAPATSSPNYSGEPAGAVVANTSGAEFEVSEPETSEPLAHTNMRPETYRISDPIEEPVSEPVARVSTPVAEAPGPARLISEEPAVPVGASSPEIDVTTVPGETEFAEVDAIEPGPCDPTASAVASSPWDLDALAAHAGCLVDIGETANGAGLYERVLAFEPGHFQAALGLAQLRERQGRRADAARLFETAADAALTDGQALAARQSARRLREEN